jgi:hypothetical protein
MNALAEVDARDPEELLLNRAWPVLREELSRASESGVNTARLAVVVVQRRCMPQFVRTLTIVSGAAERWVPWLRSFDEGVALVLPLGLVRAVCAGEAPELSATLRGAAGAGRVWALSLSTEGALATVVTVPEDFHSDDEGCR